MNPWKPLEAASQRTTCKIFKRRDHLGQCPAVFIQNHAKTHRSNPDTFFFGQKSLFFPVDADFGQKITSG